VTLLDAASSGGLPHVRLNGVLNMRNRLHDIGGRCDIQSERGHGTQVIFYVPLKKIEN
jgi:signal transduction histidine kinase